MQLPDPVTHRRRITFEKRGRRVIIEDTLLMSGVHDIELFFHCSESCQVDHAADGYRLSHEGPTIFLKLPQAEGAASRVYCGSIAPVWGWVSRHFDAKQPAPTIVWRARLANDVVLHSEVIC
jgi:hypothetical protein